MIYRLIRFVYVYYRPVPNLYTRFNVKDQWALITGAGRGIGCAYAELLASQGFNLILIDKSQRKLNAVKWDLQLEEKVAVRTIVMDVLSWKTEKGLE